MTGHQELHPGLHWTDLWGAEVREQRREQQGWVQGDEGQAAGGRQNADLGGQSAQAVLRAPGFASPYHEVFTGAGAGWPLSVQDSGSELLEGPSLPQLLFCLSVTPPSTRTPPPSEWQGCRPRRRRGGS